MTDQGLILLSIDSFGVATLTLNRPERSNAFTLAMINEWRAALVEAEQDSNVKVIVVTGAGKAFCAGGDARAMADRAEEGAIAQKDFLWRNVHTIALTLERLDKPVIAAINGAARGAGLDMALMCDIRLIAESATVAESYINLGLVAGDGGSWLLPRLVGIDWALELCWTGEVLSAKQALDLGLVTHVVPDGELMNATLELARKIAGQPQDAVRMFKRAIYQGLSMPFPAHLDMISSHVTVLRDSAEHRQRVRALSQKTKAKA
jgi:enoyl-CoA hydratase/carnithine racemase